MFLFAFFGLSSMFESFNKLPRLLSISLLFPLIFLNGWLLSILTRQLEPLVSIFIAATLISFLLDYPIRFLQRLQVKRGWAVGLVFLLFILFVAGLFIFLAPLILRQANELIVRLPEWIRSGQQQLKTFEAWAIDQQLPIDISSNLAQLVERVSSALRSLTSQLISIFFNAIGSLINIFLTLAFSLFLVIGGEEVWKGILGWLPPRWGELIRQSLPQKFEGYIVGQATLATILSIFQTLALVTIGAPLALLFGLAIGLASVIPFGGTTTIIIVSLLVALQDFGLGVRVFLIAELILQVHENVIGPRIFGEITGLNPVWTLTSLFVGIKVAGFLGLIMAVPIASFIKASAETIRQNWGEPQLAIAADLISLPDEERTEERATTP
jgi:predicted PurR-regulated permease PerM